MTASDRRPTTPGAPDRHAAPRRSSAGRPSVYRDLLDEGAAADRAAVHVERRGDRALVTLAEPDRLNVLTAALVTQLKRALADLAADPEIRAVVLTGDGRGFSAGGDLRMMDRAVDSLERREPEGAADMWRWIRNEFGAIARLIARGDTMFVAALNGPAAGVGLAWALTCDIAIAAEEAVIVPAFGKLGLLPEVGTSWALTRALGYQGAFAFYVAGEHLDARGALARGLVQEVVPGGELLAAADRWCDRACALPPHALQMTKPLLRGAADATWDGALALEEFAEPVCFTTEAFAGAVRGRLARS
ncbi:enoyl-CoA hydratase/isomerase family protein [Conexibacter arvalis]|uniref:2-(1,2-epoxy-1,2-dihydrophenyl)acetyl-CoA isomerase n=1 Tax=Conexibacter arvalis TaxID=912552 RepID=A0A840ID53_9ACTN|nr:enoyl-CoA hydratase/isomerase family protein [Conexibacter arvalis]MBB4662275.1 2-(1,2-epoxy-1,2-dihydrophenyl)acetyl-CoA isomerase [Conexibacter arvalis]